MVLLVDSHILMYFDYGTPMFSDLMFSRSLSENYLPEKYDKSMLYFYMGFHSGHRMYFLF